MKGKSLLARSRPCRHAIGCAGGDGDVEEGEPRIRLSLLETRMAVGAERVSYYCSVQL